MYRRILAPVDGSAVSTLGLHHAVALAKSQGAHLRVLNVLDARLVAPTLTGYSEADVRKILAGVGRTGPAALRSAAAFAAKRGVKPDIALLQGAGRLVSDVILEDANRWGADLIVMGTHGRRGLDRLLMGSDAQRVLGEASVPVLLVRRDKPRHVARSRSK